MRLLAETKNIFCTYFLYKLFSKLEILKHKKWKRLIDLLYLRVKKKKSSSLSIQTIKKIRIRYRSRKGPLSSPTPSVHSQGARITGRSNGCITSFSDSLPVLFTQHFATSLLKWKNYRFTFYCLHKQFCTSFIKNLH